MTTNHRDIVISKLKDVLNAIEENEIFWSGDVDTVAQNLEKSILNETIKVSETCAFDATFDDPEFLQRYKNYFQKVYFNLFRNKCAESVQQRVKDGTLNLHDIVSTPHSELNPSIVIEAYNRYNHLLFISGNSDQMKKMQSERISGIKCPKCKSTKVEYTQLQTRSGDEGISNFALCACGYRWKFS